MDVLTQSVRLLPHDEPQFDVGLEPFHAVFHMRSGLLELFPPRDVRRLVEARRDLDQDNDLFAPAGGLGEGLDNGDRSLVR